MKPLFYLLALVTTLASCRTQRYVYAPSPPNISYFKQKGDFKLTAFYSNGDNGINNANQQIILPVKKSNDGFDIQSAYAFSNHWACMLSFFQRKEVDAYGINGNIFDTSLVNYKRKLTEFGIGYFFPLNKSKTITYNIYGGVAVGSFSFIDAGTDKNSVAYSHYFENKITKPFLQGGFNFMPSKYIRFSFTGKFSFVHFSNNNTSYSSVEQQYFYLDKISDNTLTFFEPTFNLQLGIPKADFLKLEMGITASSGLPTYYPAVRGFNASIGLSLNFSALKK